MNKIYECIVGSQAYGTNLPNSDTDIKGVYCQSKDDILGLKYVEQLNPDKDTSYYEVRRFVDLCGAANPNILEMLFAEDRFVKEIHPAFEIIRKNRHMFLTKLCKNSFGGYAVGQIKRAKGLDKKMNWEKSQTIRKTPLDFCYIQYNGGSIPIVEFLKREQLKQELCGLCAIDHMPNCYYVYYDYVRQFTTPEMNYKGLEYKGIIGEDSNELRLSSIPKEQVGQHLGIMYYNADAYSIHCKKHTEYLEWLKNRNTDRYVDTENHGQQIDGKNIMHCVRLIDCALEIAQTGNLTVFRPNREELLNIRKGNCNLNDIIKQSEDKIALMDELFSKSNLPDNVDMEFKHNLILEVRNEYYKSLFE